MKRIQSIYFTIFVVSVISIFAIDVTKNTGRNTYKLETSYGCF